MPVQKVIAVGTGLYFLISLGAALFAQGTIGLNFTALSAPTDAIRAIDTMGAIGPDAFVELINKRFAVFNKHDGTIVNSALHMDEFWQRSLPSSAGTVTASVDPRVLFDHDTGRWFACAYAGVGGPRNLLLAVSKTSDPRMPTTGSSWDAYAIPASMIDNTRLGINASGVFITDIQRNDLYSFPKAELIGGSTANHTRFDTAQLGLYAPINYESTAAQLLARSG